MVEVHKAIFRMLRSIILNITGFYALLHFPAYSEPNINDTILNSLATGNFSELRDSSSCLAQFYYASISTKIDKLPREFNNCGECEISALHNYYCVLAEYNSMIGNRDTLLSVKVLERFSGLEFKDVFSDEELNGIAGKVRFLTQLALEEKAELNEILAAKLEDGRYFHEGFLIDTGSVFSTTKDCLNTIGEASINFISGENSIKKICESSKGIAIEYKINIIGFHGINNYDSIIFSEDKTETIGVELYIDNDVMFFVANEKNTDINVCLDSGATKTHFTAKSKSRMKNELESRRTVIVETGNAEKIMSFRAKILPETVINLKGFEYTLSNTPVFLDHSQWMQCDLIAGADFIKNYITEINLKEREIKINKLSSKTNNVNSF